MAGHSKWANIKHRKAAADAKRGTQFTKLAKELMVSAKLGGSDANSNPRLRAAITKARSMNMPKDNIEKAIKKGAGELDGVTYEEIVYEAYGPNGVAIIIEVLTDKKSRTLPEIKNILSKAGGNMGEAGSVSYLFDHMGVILLEQGEVTEENPSPEPLNEDAVMETVLESGAEDYEKDDENLYVVKTQKEQFHAVLDALAPAVEQKGWKIGESGLRYVPKSMIELAADAATKTARLIDNLDNHDDVQNVYSNLDESGVEEDG